MANNNCLPGMIAQIQCDQICVKKQVKPVNPMFKTNIFKFYFLVTFCFALDQKNVVGALSIFHYS